MSGREHGHPPKLDVLLGVFGVALALIIAFGLFHSSVGPRPGNPARAPQPSPSKTPSAVSDAPPPADTFRPSGVVVGIEGGPSVGKPSVAVPAVVAGPHALLVRPGTRFQTVANERLAVHGPVTMEMWVKVVEPAEGMTEGVTQVQLHNFAFWLRGQTVAFLAQSAYQVTWPDLGVGVWRYVAATFDGARLHLYIDGVEVASGGASLAGNSLGVQEGVRIAHTNPPGPVVAIDELRVFSRPRSQEQIRADMHAEAPVGDPDLLSAWSFDEGEGQEVHDAGRYGLHGWLGTDPTRPDGADPLWITDTPSRR